MSYKDNNCKAPSDISNFDVLLRKHEDGHVEIMSYKDNVGNRRLQIFLDIHRSSYNEALHKNDLEECERIAGKVVYTICHSCVPKGRFLEQDFSSTNANNMAGWRDLGNGTLARERIRRGFLGLLFTLPFQTRSESTLLPPKKKKKKEFNVNLAEERFVVIENEPHTETRYQDEDSDMTSSCSDTFDGIVSNEISYDLPNMNMLNYYEENDSTESDVETLDEMLDEMLDEIANDKEADMSESDSDTFDDIVPNNISYDITAILTPTMVSKSLITNDDILFHGENADIIFNFNHVGNNRLRCWVTQKSKSCSFDNQMDAQFLQYAQELVRAFIQAYPNTRFLRQQNRTSIDMWIQMDVDTAISKMSSSLFYASKYFSYFSTESVVDNSSDMNCNKSFKIKSPQGSTSDVWSVNILQQRCNVNTSKAA